MSLLEQISPESAMEPNLLGWWSANQILAHLIGWQEGAMAVLIAVRDNETLPSDEDEDSFNAKSVDRRADKSWTEMKNDFAETNNALLSLARSLSEIAWQDPNVSGWLRGSTVNHYPIHRADFRRIAAY
jgi:hypothetical protein